MPVNDPWLPATNGNNSVPNVRPKILVKVFRVAQSFNSSLGTPFELTNVRCTSVEKIRGTDPGRAIFRYVFDGRDNQAPQSAAQAVSTNNNLTKTVKIGDRLAVAAYKPDGSYEWIFDGYPYTWHLVVKNGVDMCFMKAVGVAKRCWDTPIAGALMRDEAKKLDKTANVPTDLPAAFNPKGRPNASPATADAGNGQQTYAVMRDPTFLYDGVDSARFFDLAMAVGHVLYVNNNQTFVQNPPRTVLDGLFVSREPKDGAAFNPNDAGTYDPKPIVVPDTPIKGRDWPTTVWDLINDYGFGMAWQLTNDSNNQPTTSMSFWYNQAGPVKQLMLQPKGGNFDPTQSNTNEIDCAREIEDVANAWDVEGALVRYECSFILAPVFVANPNDGALAGGIAQFDLAQLAGQNYDKYRTYVFDETGDGHYDPGGTQLKTTAPSLDDVLGAPQQGQNGQQQPQYLARHRKPIPALLTRDPNNPFKEQKFSLAISTDYAGQAPAVWDRSGTWQTIQGGYTLLKDRIGIRINIENPNKWHIGEANGNVPYPLGIVKGVEDACGGPKSKKFYLRLTCVIEGDKRIVGSADMRPGNPLPYKVRRTVDAHDRYFKHVVHNSSSAAAGGTNTIRDDTDQAKAEAMAVRFATENGVFKGSCVIPRFTNYYNIGDRIDQVEGRGIAFQTNTGNSTDAPILPQIVGITWNLEGNVSTIITLDDSGTDRTSYKQALRAKVGPAHAKH